MDTTPGGRTRMMIEERKNREEIDEHNQSGANEFPGTYHERAWTWEHRSHWEN